MRTSEAGPPVARRSERSAVTLAVAVVGLAIVLIAGGIMVVRGLGTRAAASSGPPPTPASASPARFTGDGYSIVLPAGIGSNPIRIAQGDFWTSAGRSLSVGPLTMSPGTAANVDEALDRMEAELAIPGRGPFSPPARATLPAGQAAWVTTSVGAMRFVCYAVVTGGRAYRLVFVGFSDDEARRIASTFAFE